MEQDQHRTPWGKNQDWVSKNGLKFQTKAIRGVSRESENVFLMILIKEEHH